MSDFHVFARAVNVRYNKLAKHELFVVANPEEHDIRRVYLDAFPAGTNPVYITNTEHDCTCCKNFLKHLGIVVGIDTATGQRQTLWEDLGDLPYPYDVVANALHAFVMAQPIVGIFRSSERSYGAEKTLQNAPSGQKKWNHFWGQVHDRHHTRDVGRIQGDAATRVATLKRGLEELTPQAIEDILELIQNKTLYRGDEHKHALANFQQTQQAYLRLPRDMRELFLWSNHLSPASHFRNSVIGTLAVDLSLTGNLDASVRSFEAKVAPANYKRPTALVTPRMVEDAMKTIKDLGIEDSLVRRMARLSDVSVNNVLWVDNTARSKMKDGGLSGMLMDAVSGQAPAQTKAAKAEPISIDDFMAQVLPKATEMRVLVKNHQMPNFVTLTAPVHDTAPKVFKWDNGFAWSYDGNVTDSIKEKVKAAGGNVTSALLRVSLAWFNHDDLDLHCYMPTQHIYFANKAGVLDVDMNAGVGRSRQPVENMSFTKANLRDGTYLFQVNQYSRRETEDTGFELEVETAGVVHNFRFPAAMATDKSINCLEITIKAGALEDLKIMDKGLIGGSFSQEKWGVKTEQFVKVNTVMLSPNHWDGQEVGNKHWFFILDKCLNGAPTRGIYNEFLSPELDKHRKVFELVGNKTKCEPTDDQLSGLGFSSTKGEKVIVEVTGPKLRKQYEINF